MKTLYDEVLSQVCLDRQVELFIRDILKNANVYLFGGAVRDYLDNNFNNIRDFDFVVDFKDCNDTIETYINTGIRYKKNRFNGYKLILQDISIDIWEMKETWAFKEKLLYPSVDNLLKSVFLNIDSVVYSMNEHYYIDSCDAKYRKIIKNRMLDVVLTETPQIELNLLRAMVLREKYRLDFSNNLKKIFMKCMNFDEFPNKLVKLQDAHYGKQILDENSIRAILNDI